MEEENDLFIDDSQRNLANVKKMVWQGFKTFVPGGSLANVVLDQNEMGDLEFTKPKYLEAVPFVGEALYNRLIDDVFSTSNVETKNEVDKKNSPIIKSGEGEYDPGKDTVFIPKNELTNFQLNNELWSVAEPNYGSIEGADDLTPNFLNQWQTKAKTGEKTFYFDISNHRILDVPGMDNIVNQTRYRQWLTQNLINRYNEANLSPGVEKKRFSSNTDFVDSQGQYWRFVKADQSAVGPNQTYIPTPLSEIDSRKMKSENSSESDRVLLRELMKLNVKERNALEKKHPWLIDWNSDTSGQNYHEHMIGLDETEFWKSAYGKSLGYMNNDVYVLDKGLGNIVFLNDPKFKVMKDQIAEYITPSKKSEVYPGKKVRTFPVKKFTAGKYKGLNAVIGYEADINSPNKSDLVIYAYDPSSTKNIGFKTEYTIPNYYSVLYAKNKDGSNLFPIEIREGILHSLVDSYLNDTPEMLVRIEDITDHVYKRYGINIDLKNPKALEQWNEDFGVISSDSQVDTSADEKIFKTTSKNERLQKKVKKQKIKEFLYLLDLAKNGRYKQLNLELLYPDDRS
jgi:hypothetical protein